MDRKKKTLLRGTGLALVLALIVVGVALATAVTVDTFNEGTQNLVVDPNPPTQTQSGTADDIGILGGERDIELNWISGPGFASARVDLFGTNALLFSEDSGVTANAKITWDGDDNDPLTLAPTGLGGADLTDSGSNDGFRVQVINADLDTSIKLTVYTNASNWSEYTLDIPGGILGGNRVDFFAPFNQFSGGAGTTNFASAGAVVMTVDGTVSPGTDLNVDLMEASGDRDFGDLPNTYPAAVLAGNHIPLGLRLGSNVDVETSAQTSLNADGDNNDQTPDDEDGVSPTPGVNWVADSPTGGSITVVVKGCESNACKLSGWVDWGNDGTFLPVADNILNDRTVRNGTSIITFAIPLGADVTDNSLYARFRLCEIGNICDTATAVNVSNGEVEDYLWDFGPTAVTLTGLSAEATDGRTALTLLGVSLLLVAGLLLAARVGLFRRRI